MTSRPAVPPAPYGRQVFVNCPYDEDYLPLLRALVFTIHACGFSSRLAADVSTSGTPRLQRILELIRVCRFGIHDLSRAQLAPRTPLPRFNMPFECGIFLGAQAFGDKRQRSKDWLLLEAEPHRHQRSLSDAAGLDPQVHGNDPTQMIGAVRRFLAGHIDPRPLGVSDLKHMYAAFQSEYPALAAQYGHEVEDLLQLKSLADWRWIAANWLALRAAATRRNRGRGHGSARR